MIQSFLLVLLILPTAEQSLSLKCERLNKNLENLCKNTGYNLTGRFPVENGTHYQDKVYKDVHRDHKLFSNCSKLSQLMVCSRYVPKCLENETLPILPCKQECQKFVQDCRIELAENNLERFYTDLCGLKGNSSREGCLKSEGIKQVSNSSAGEYFFLINAVIYL